MKWLFYISLLLCSCSALSQNISVVGTVKDASYREAIPHCQIVVISPNDTSIVVANEKGKYKIPVKENTTYQFQFQATLMVPKTHTVKVKKKTIKLNVILEESNNLPEFEVTSSDSAREQLTFMKPIDGVIFTLGKKSVAIGIEDLDVNVGTASSRQVYKSVPGLNIWESDGAGIQLGIGGRGLSPNRTANFNTRQNGYDMSADALGYPETYYTPPLEALDRIQLIRGAASLQFGTQFGGLLNFVLKEGNRDTTLAVEVKKTLGSFGLNSLYISAGGTKNKWNYYTYVYHKYGNDFRPNARFNVWSGHTHLQYEISEKASISGEFTHMQYLNQQAGGLTDLQFYNDPLQSNRERNWFAVNWNLASIKLHAKLGSKLRLESQFFGLMAFRKALGFLGNINRIDPLQERDLIWGEFKNYGNETRLLGHYNVKNKTWFYVVGTRFYRGYSSGLQGDADPGYGPTFNYMNDAPNESDYEFPSQNHSIFGEHIFYLTDRFAITPGFRFEHILTAANGRYYNRILNGAGQVVFEEIISETRSNERTFVLGGLGISQKWSDSVEFYTNFSQNYRSISFSDIQIANPNFQIDPDIQDEKGFNFDIGVRGQIPQRLTYDISAFYLQYRDRIGILNQRDPVLFNTFQYRTNVADSRTLGIESFVSWNALQALVPASKIAGYVFTNLAFIHSEYINTDNSAIQGKQVEHVPNITAKIGLRIKWGKWSVSSQYSYTSDQYSDATNAQSTPNSVNGIIPAYQIVDLSASFQANANLKLDFGINNLLNESYFTRRAGGYPGPGIIPSATRNFYVTGALNF